MPPITPYMPPGGNTPITTRPKGYSRWYHPQSGAGALVNPYGTKITPFDNPAAREGVAQSALAEEQHMRDLVRFDLEMRQKLPQEITQLEGEIAKETNEIQALESQGWVVNRAARMEKINRLQTALADRKTLWTQYETEKKKLEDLQNKQIEFAQKKSQQPYGETKEDKSLESRRKAVADANEAYDSMIETQYTDYMTGGLKPEAPDRKTWIDDYLKSTGLGELKPDEIKQTGGEDFGPPSGEPLYEATLPDNTKVFLYGDNTIRTKDGKVLGHIDAKGKVHMEKPKTKQTKNPYEAKTKKPAPTKAQDNRMTVSEFFSQIFKKPSAQAFKNEIQKDLGVNASNEKTVTVNAETFRNLWQKAKREGKTTAKLYHDIYMAFLGQPSTDLTKAIGNIKLPVSK